MIIYFHIDELNRDSIVASVLREKFANEGDTVIYGNRLISRLLKIFHFLFDIIIVPRPHFLYDSWGDEYLKWNSKIIILSTESLGIICKDYKVMARTLLEKGFFENDKSVVNRIDAFCLWGSRQHDAVSEFHSEQITKFHIVGHPRHDKLCLMPKDNKKNKTRIGIVTRSVSINDYQGRSTLDAFSTLLDDHFQFEFHNKITGEKLKSTRPGAFPAETIAVSSLDTAVLIKIISELNNKDFELYLRPHPKEDISIWKKILISNKIKIQIVDPFEPITHWLTNIDFLIGPPSTSFYDAIMLGVCPISINGIDKRRDLFIGELWEDNNRLMPSILQPNSIEEVLEIVKENKSYVPSPEILKILNEEANFPNCLNSLDKVVEVCNKVYIKKPKSTKYIFLFFIAKYIFQIFWKIRNVVYKIKPNSSYFALDSKTITKINQLHKKLQWEIKF